MFRHTPAAQLVATLALCAVMLLVRPAAAQVPAAPVTEADPVPKASLVDWYLNTETSDYRTYFKPEAAASGYARLWVRAEQLVDGVTFYRSFASLVEFDCAQARLRFRETTYYAKNGLADAISKVSKASAWRYPEPFDPYDYARRDACKADKPRPLSEFEAAEPAPWAVIEALDWLQAPPEDDYMLFFKPGPGGDQTRTWLRIEYREPVDGILSAVVLYEADCATGKLRSIQHSHYAANNLRGAMTSGGDAAAKWLFPVPGSLDEAVYARACQDAAARLKI